MVDVVLDVLFILAAAGLVAAALYVLWAAAFAASATGYGGWWLAH